MKEFKDTQALVEANSFEQHSLWVANEARDQMKGLKKFSWDQDCSGVCKCIGKIDGKQIWVSFSWATVQGVLVAFYYCTSVCADYDQINSYLKEQFPHLNKNHKADAMNFTNALNLKNK